MLSTTDEIDTDPRFPYLRVAIEWIAAHCIVPDRARMGEPFRMYPWQTHCTQNFYRVRTDAVLPGTIKKDGSEVSPASAFVYRRGLIVAPQKTGKGPWAAAIVSLEAVGPTIYAGFAHGGEVYDCADHGCPCGWGYVYAAGEPMATPRVKPLIQLLATSEDQTDNVYRPLQAMARGQWLSSTMRVSEGFIRLPDDGRIDAVTASAQSKLGNPATFALQDEVGLYTKSNKLLTVANTQRRNVAAMGGRALGTTNAWDPTENSDAQQTNDSRVNDIFIFYRRPPVDLKYTIKADRRRIHAYVYAGSSHVDLDNIEAESAELIETDPAQAERFYGNRLVQGAGAWMPDGLWKKREVADRVVPPGTIVTLGFDGSDNDDHTALRLRTGDGFRFTPTYGPDKRPTIWNPAEWSGTIPRAEVHAAVDEICKRYKVVRAYLDPPYWSTEIGDWALKYGDKVFIEWSTSRQSQMHDALRRALTDLSSGISTHDACPLTEQAVTNARKLARTGERYILGKPTQHQKIDAAMADVLANEAGEDARLEGLFVPAKPNYIYLG